MEAETNMARGGRSSRNNNIIYGSDGNDLLGELDGSFEMVGGKGDDTYIVDDTGDKVVEKNRSGTDLVKSSIDYVLGKHVENLTLVGTDNLSGTGNDSDNIIIGNSGDNMLYGLGGNDTLDGGDGDDTLDGGAGNDTLDGGDGADTAVFAGSYSDYVFERNGTDLHVTYKTGETDILRNIEFLSFSDRVIAESEIGDPAVLLAGADAATVAEDDPVVTDVLADDSGEVLSVDTDSTALVTVDVSSVNDAPIASDDSYSATSGLADENF